MTYFPGAVPTRPVDEVTRVSAREEADHPLGSAARNGIWRRVVHWYRSGMTPAISISLRQGGRVLLDRSIGTAQGTQTNTPTPATPDTLFHVFSASKMVVAILVLQAMEEGLLDLDAPVATYIPEFAVHGKEKITVRDVLAHRAGLPGLAEPTTLDLLNNRPRIVQSLITAKPKIRPGRLAYHALTGGYLLAEILERVTGQGLQERLQLKLARPLGLEHFRYGAKSADHHRIAENIFTGPPVLPPLSWAVRGALGISAEEATRLSNHQRFCDAIVPAGNLVTSADQACRLMELLRCGGQHGGVRILESQTIKSAIASRRTRFELDSTLLLPVRYGLGFMLGDWIGPYGIGARRAYGHLGFLQILLWVDPERNLSGALLSSGKTFLSPGLLHFAAVMQTIASRCPKR